MMWYIQSSHVGLILVLLLLCVVVQVSGEQAAIIVESDWVVVEVGPGHSVMQVKGDKVAWSNNSSYEVTVFDLATHQATTYPLLSSDGCEYHFLLQLGWTFEWPWAMIPTGCSYQSPPLFYNSVAVFNLETGQSYTLSLPDGEIPPHHVFSLDVDKEMIVWTAANTLDIKTLDPATFRIYLSDLNTGESEVLFDEVPPRTEWFSTLDDEWGAWLVHGLESGGCELRLRNWVTSVLMTVILDNCHIDGVDIDGEWLIWESRIEAEANPHYCHRAEMVQGFNLVSQEVMTLLTAESVGTTLCQCAVFGERVACYGWDNRVFVHEIETGVTTAIYAGEHLSMDTFSADNNIITFSDQGNLYIAFEAKHRFYIPLIAKE